MLRVSPALLLGAALTLPCAGQLNVAPAPPPAQLDLSGSVTGHVYDESTRLPLRFARVVLIPEASMAGPLETEEVTTPSGKFQRPKRGLSQVEGNTGFNGVLNMTGVPPGEYLIAAAATGYLPQVPSFEHLMDKTEDQLRDLIASLPRVRVGPNQTSTFEVALHRGAVISGRLQFPDGSPASNLVVSTLAPNTLALFRNRTRQQVSSYLLNALSPFAMGQPAAIHPSDDDGRFRISGISPGKYYVTTQVQLPPAEAQVHMTDGSSPSDSRMYSAESVTVYAPGVFGQKDARLFDIRGDEQITDADFILRTDNNLYSVTVSVVAGVDRHVPQNGFLLLLQGDEMPRMVGMDSGGVFHLHMLQPGSYNLRISASDADPRAQPPINASPLAFHVANFPFVITDHDLTLDPIVLTLKKPGEPDENPFF